MRTRRKGEQRIFSFPLSLLVLLAFFLSSEECLTPPRLAGMISFFAGKTVSRLPAAIIFCNENKEKSKNPMVFDDS